MVCAHSSVHVLSKLPLVQHYMELCNFPYLVNGSLLPHWTPLKEPKRGFPLKTSLLCQFQLCLTWHGSEMVSVFQRKLKGDGRKERFRIRYDTDLTHALMFLITK